MKNFHSKGPLGRPAQPSEVATSFVFLASMDASTYCKFSSPIAFSVRLSLADRVLTTHFRIDGQILHPYPIGD